MTEEQQILEEANRELLECARYGEDEDLLTLMNQYGANVNHTDDNGNTALHRAAANGHIKCLQVLKEHGALHVKNKEGNYPIHWAAQNGQADALKFLFDCYEVDVLEKNDQGRSTLTEAFQSGNANAIECCLSHPTASEDKLIPGKAPTSEEEPVESASPEKNEVTHVMKFSPLGDVVKIRELPITRADHPFGSEERPEDDTTGLGIWPAAVLLSRWIVHLGDPVFRGKTVLELGAGSGLPSLAAAIYCGPSQVFISDIHEPTLENARHNITLNTRPDSRPVAQDFVRVSPTDGQETILSLRKINWKDFSSFPAEPVDVLLGSDLVYDANILAILVPAVAKLLKPDGQFLYVAPDTGRDGMTDLIESLLAIDMVCVESFPVPDEMYGNPLADQEDQDSFILYFYDLSIKQPHTFYRFAFAGKTV